MTKLVFRLLAICYTAGIFLFADSPVVADLAPFNPESLLHIPLYGILTLLLVFSVLPYSTRSTDSTHSTHSTYSTEFIIAGLIAVVVAVADEVHQVYVPGRNSSIYDVLLDVVGIVLCLFIIWRFKSRCSSVTQ